MTADGHESELDTELMYFRSADDTAPRFAPPNYRPRCVRGPVIYEDEIPDLPLRPGWDRDFDGGSSSSLIFLRAVGNGELVRISKMNPFRIEWDIALYDQYTQETCGKAKVSKTPTTLSGWPMLWCPVTNPPTI